MIFGVVAVVVVLVMVTRDVLVHATSVRLIIKLSSFESEVVGVFLLQL